MCGIAGYVGWQLSSQEREETVRSMCDAIAHRGPDDQGIWTDERVGLGMRRLSIIDVSGGHQPIANEDGSVRVVFNGEIYNHHELRRRLSNAGHRFSTRSDTEVLVHLYEEFGDAMVSELRGMFAFAIWDGRQSRLFVARDRLGIKPLSYWATDNGLMFCSELRSLLAFPGFPARISREAIGRYLAFGYVPDPDTVFEGVRKLPPGHTLVWAHDTGPRVSRYWDAAAVRESPWSEEDASRELARLLDEAVECRLESEVPLGAFLSGGLDSSTVTAIMARHSTRPVKTFAIGFAEGAYNEADDAREIARAIGTEHTELVVSPDVDALVDGLVSAFDEPFADSSAIPTYLVSQLAKRQVTVVLSGDGGDELFGGYTRYAKIRPRPELPGVARSLLGGALRHVPHGVRGRNFLMDLTRTRAGQYTNQVMAPLLEAEGGVGQQDLAAWVGSIEVGLRPHFDHVRDRSFGTQMMLVDIATYLPGDILTKVDRTSMAVSLEARVPLLDHHLVEFAMSLPEGLKFDNGRGKAIFRKAIAGIVPERTLSKPKQGFAVPLAEWFRGPLAHRLTQLEKPDNRIYEYVREKSVRRLLHEHRGHRRDHSPVLWRLMVLSLWLDHLTRRTLSASTPRDLATVR